MDKETKSESRVGESERKRERESARESFFALSLLLFWPRCSRLIKPGKFIFPTSD